MMMGAEIELGQHLADQQPAVQTGHQPRRLAEMSGLLLGKDAAIKGDVARRQRTRKHDFLAVQRL